jgi:uncharacterized protein
LPEGTTCWNNLQTNGLHFSDEWCDFLAANRFDVGLSIDGAAQIHDRCRKDTAGGATYDRVAANIKRLKAHGVRPDLLCTVTSWAAKEPLEVYRALRAFDTGWVQFIPIVVPSISAAGQSDGAATGAAAKEAAIAEGAAAKETAAGSVTEESVTAEQYGRFLCDIFDEWLVRDVGRLDVQLFAETIAVRAGGAASVCWMAPVCGRALVVEFDGGVYSCDHFVRDEYRLGDLSEDFLGELADLPEQRRFGESKQTSLPELCRRCPWLAFCNGGCPKDRLPASTDAVAGLNRLCAGYRQFFSHAMPWIDRLLELRGRGLSAAGLAEAVRREFSTRWDGVGRNDPCPCGSGKKAKQCCWHKRP